MMKPAEVALALNVSTESLRMYAEDGRIPFVSTPGGHRRYILEDVKHALSMEKAAKIAPLEESEHADRGPVSRRSDQEARAPMAGLAACGDPW